MTAVPPVAAGTTELNSAASVRLAADTQSFLKLMTAQLANQDPLAPMDPTQFVSQLAQFSTVEQAVQSNLRLGEVLSELRASGDRLDLSYLNRRVEVLSEHIALAQGGAQARYSIPPDTAAAEIRILDADGRLVRSLPAETLPGQHALTWDGRDAAGLPRADGPYRVEVVARNSAGDSLPTAMTVNAQVTRVHRQDGTTLFQLDNGLLVGREDILSAG